MTACESKSIAGPDLSSLSPERLQRYQRVQLAIRHAWEGYQKICLQRYIFSARYWLGILPEDDLSPLSNTGTTWLHSAATLYDSLDTLYLTGLMDEYDEAAELVKKLPLPLHPTKTFEYSIRVLGGLLGGFTVSGDVQLLSAATRVADSMLEGAFKSSPTALPRMFDVVAPATTSKSFLWGWGSNIIHRIYARIYRNIRDHMGEHRINSLAGVGSFSLEFSYLSQLTGDPKYKDAADAIFQHVNYNKISSNMVPSTWNVMTGKETSKRTSLGSGSDSFYEYLIKMAVLSQPIKDKNDIDALQTYVDVVSESLLNANPPNVKASQNENASYPVDGNSYNHLLCFIPGMLALGETYYLGELNYRGDDNDKVMPLAKKLANGCLDSYERSSTGLGPEEIFFPPKNSHDQVIVDSGFYLRPEFVESLFILYRTTGNQRYQEIAWGVFQSIERYCKVNHGYVGLKDVNADGTLNFVDEMPSFFLAETFKYLALIFAPDDYVSLDFYVFTTEAHPLLQARHRDKDCTFESLDLRQPASPILALITNGILFTFLLRQIIPRILGRRRIARLKTKKRA